MTTSDKPDENKMKIEVQKLTEIPSDYTAKVIRTVDQYIDSGLMVLGILAKQAELSKYVINSYNIREDFDWFASGQVETKDFRGKFIAIWRKQVVASGDTAVEAERVAMAYFGEDIRPAVVYIPKDPLAIL